MGRSNRGFAAGPSRPKPSVGAKPSDERDVASRACQWRMLLVVGAGPAGVAAAITLAAAGRDVTMIDKAVFPAGQVLRGRPHDAGAPRAGDVGLRSGPGRRLAARSTARSCGRRPAARSPCRCRPGPGRSPPSSPASSSTPRSSRPPSRPASRVITGAGFDGELGDGADHVVSGVAGRDPISARYVVAADGMWSPVRKAAGLTATGVPRRVARLPAVRRRRHRIGARPPPRLVRARLPPRLRMVVSRCPAVASISASASSRDGTPPDPGHEAAVGGPPRAPAHPPGRSGPSPRSRTATPPGRSPPASTGRCWPAAGCCSPAMRRWPAT